VSVPVWRTFARFNIVGALGIVVQLSTLAALTSVGQVSYLPATFVAVSAAIAHNFVWHMRWTWRERAGAFGRVDRAFARFALSNGAVSLFGNMAVMALLSGMAGLPPVPANVVAIAVTGLANFFVADRIVFWAPAVAGPLDDQIE
jgi:putative flippase GtrA